MPIKVLTSDLISKIAAGEVIERPASVVKELLENALDANATQISIEVRGGGINLIKVIDNGIGIPPQEIEIAFERHATSKLSDIDDLENIASLGFRGEALPSIASVSEISMVSRNSQEMVGVAINLKDGLVVQRSSRGTPIGTTVTVKNLFANVPARLKFLKSANTELGHIADLVTNYSLSFTKVKFVLVLDGRTSIRTSGSGDLRQAVSEVYGLDVAKAMLDVQDTSQSSIKVIGMVSQPSINRANRSYISLFVNKRWIQSRTLSWAIEEAYHGMLMQGRHPIAIINLQLEPKDIDVNVHPTKNEVRFREEREVFAAVQKAVRHALIEQTPIPPVKSISPSSSHMPVQSAPRSEAKTLWPRDKTSNEITNQTQLPQIQASKLPPLRVLGQVSSTYIIAEGPEGIYLIDQHAAHERVQFEKFMAQRQSNHIERQGLLEPLSIEVSPQQEEVLKTQTLILAEYGFDIENFGQRSYLIRAIPAMLSGENVIYVINEIVDCLTESDVSKREERIAASMACHGSVRAGQVLKDEEMRQLVRQLEKTDQPRTCPHGRPTMIHLSAAQLEHEFGRR